MSKVDNVTSYHCMQFQGKHMIQTQENGEKPHFGPNLGQLGPIGRAIFLFIFFFYFFFFQKSGFASH